MQGHNCDGCGGTIPAGGLFYRCRTEIISGFDNYIPDPVDKADQVLKEACRSLKSASPEELMNDVYEEFKLLLCPACRQKLRKQLMAIKGGGKKTSKVLLFPPRP